MEEKFQAQFKKIKTALGHVKKFACITADVWLSKKKSFSGMTTHWIKTDLTRKSVAIACEHFKGTYSFTMVSDKIEAIIWA